MNIFKKVSYKVKRIYNSYSFGDYMRTAYLSPRQVVLITSRFDNQDNVLPVDWHIPLSFSPKLYAVCLESGNHSSAMILKSGVFVVNFMPAECEKQIIECGRLSGKDTDKFGVTGLEKSEASKINAPIIKNAVGYLECKLVDTITTGDHTLFIGEVLAEKEAGNAERLFHITN
ncbi:MAG: flavin reductase family protein [Ignavibacteria bacterium]